MICLKVHFFQIIFVVTLRYLCPLKLFCLFAFESPRAKAMLLPKRFKINRASSWLLQCVSRIWTSLNWSNLIMMVWFRLYPIFATATDVNSVNSFQRGEAIISIVFWLKSSDSRYTIFMFGKQTSVFSLIIKGI